VPLPTELVGPGLSIKETGRCNTSSNLEWSVQDGMFTQARATLVEFFNDVRSELKKISYPSRSETIGSTTVVIILVLIVSLFLRLADIVISLLIVKIL